MHEYEVQLIRVAMGKPPTQVFNPGVGSGKLDGGNKIPQVRDNFVRYLDTKFSGLSSEAKYNFADAKESQAADEVPSCDCSLPGCRSPTSCASGSSWARVGGCRR